MRRVSFLLSLSLISQYIALCQSEHILWYDEPAEYFEEALVLGNGTMGATVFGGVDHEMIYLNDATLWSGEPVDPDMNPDAHQWIPKIRAALDREDYQLADSLQRYVQGAFSQSYMPLGTLHLDVKHDAEATDYRRSLSLDNAISEVTYRVAGIDYKREYFISYPDRVMVMKLTSSKASTLNVTLGFESQMRHKVSTGGNMLTVDGYAPYHVEPSYRGDMPDAILWDKARATRFSGLLEVKHQGGTINRTDSTIVIAAADEIIITASIATSFNGYDKNPATEGRDHVAIAKDQLEKSNSFTVDQLRDRHLADYTSFFSRLSLQLEDTELIDLPTDDRLRLYGAGADDKGLEILYFQFGRYLLIASSRTPGVPANLQGIWNPYIRPPWSSNYTININAQENYWLAEIGNLSELHQPMLQFINNVAKTGRTTAQNFYGTAGWVAGHNSDIWAMSNPVGDFGQGDPRWANWNMGGTWLSTHLWEHYMFTQDKDYLQDEAYATMKGAAEFCLDWLVEDEEGYLITSPSTSPENGFITKEGYRGTTLYGATADITMIRAVFDQFIKASTILELDDDMRSQVAVAKNQLRPYQIGKDGSLQEWYHDWQDQDPQHRHQTHLWGLHPGRDIDPATTPDLAEACRVALEIKGDETTGWSKGWRINLWARLWDGDRAYKMYRELLNYVEPDGKRDNGVWAGGGTYPNLLDAHPPFQIDGNFGGAAAVIEMLVQSTEDEIILLPALPSAWHTGSITGVMARGAYEVDIEWRDGRPLIVTITALEGGITKLRFKDEIRQLQLSKGGSVEIVWL